MTTQVVVSGASALAINLLLLGVAAIAWSIAFWFTARGVYWLAGRSRRW